MVSYRYNFGRMVFVIVNYTILLLISLSMLIPFINIVSISLSNEIEVIKSKYMLFPQHFTFGAYQAVFHNSILFGGIMNSVKVVLIGVPCSVVVTSMAAYILTLDKMAGNRILGHMLVFSMMFYPGVVPLYLLYKKLHMLNNHTVLIIPFLMLPYFLIYVKNYFYTIHDSLKESARLDGAGELTILFRVIMPLSMPILAVLTLFYLVNYWNLFTYPLLFINDVQNRTIQPILNSIVTQTDAQSGTGSTTALFGQNVAMAVMVISTLPILLIYPYLQKYLVEGILLGGVKE